MHHTRLPVLCLALPRRPLRRGAATGPPPRPPHQLSPSTTWLCSCLPTKTPLSPNSSSSSKPSSKPSKPLAWHRRRGPRAVAVEEAWTMRLWPVSSPAVGSQSPSSTSSTKKFALTRTLELIPASFRKTKKEKRQKARKAHEAMISETPLFSGHVPDEDACCRLDFVPA